MSWRPPEWTRDAACVPYGVDPWSGCMDEDDPRDRGMQEFLGRYICRRCPVRDECVQDAIASMPKVDGEHTMRAGLTPVELKRLAKRLGRPARKRAQHGTRSRYTAGCRCEECRRAHAEYEHERRLRKK